MCPAVCHLHLEVAGRFEWLELGLHPGPTIVSSGARDGSLAVPVWKTRWLSLTAAGYLLGYERPPLDEPTQLLSWQALLRLSFAIQ